MYTITDASDTMEVFYNNENILVIFSNETVYEAFGGLDRTDDIVVESLTVSISTRIVAQCNHTIENNAPVRVTYEYTSKLKHQ